MRICLLALGQRSTQFYESELKEGSRNQCQLLQVQLDFSVLNEHLPNDFPVLSKMLSAALLRCEAEDQLIIPNITLHETLDYHCDKFVDNLNVSHPIKLSIEECIKTRVNRVTVFASRYSMESSYIRSAFEVNGIEVMAPKPTEIEFLDEFRRAVYLGVETQAQLKGFAELMKSYAQKTTVLVACTELSIMLEEEMIGVGVIDSARLQISHSLQQSRAT